MKQIIKYILLTALRDWLYIGLLIILAGTLGISVLLGYSALSEESQMQTIYFAASSRVVIVCGILLFICFNIKRAFENKEIHFILSKPISRYSFVMAYWLGFNMVAMILIAPLFLVLMMHSAVQMVGLAYWTLSLVLEILLISTFAIVASLILRSAVSSVLAAFSFYLLSRLMGFFVYAIKIPDDPLDIQIGSLTGFMELVLKALSVIFPRLDIFTKSEWLIYNVTNFGDFSLIISQSLIYIPFMLLVAFFDFKRKQF